MTNQELYDTVVQRMNAQGGPSKYITTDGCAYRGPNDRACAVGCLIKDEFYYSDFESYTVRLDVVRLAVQSSLGCGLSHEQIQLLFDLQRLHDMNWKEGEIFPFLSPDRARKYGIRQL